MVIDMAINATEFFREFDIFSLNILCEIEKIKSKGSDTNLDPVTRLSLTIRARN